MILKDVYLIFVSESGLKCLIYKNKGKFMLSELRLRNFKAFGDKEQKAPLSKITLIYGPNSGGKSSVIQGLLLLKQSLGKWRDEE